MVTKKEKKLVAKFMVAASHDIFGEDVVTDVNLMGSLQVDKEQLLVFRGEKFFDTKIEAMKHLESISHLSSSNSVAWIVQEIFTWEVA
ncbi:MAG: hypothetical protein Unbinned4234contig1003_37 [Prokaryotic dsDNA virus sp.]|nr:MAG: hypothetical protein Unbinned4234contig1003_37 [Prokaryotic dsDNA virus sp.]|tara:strand:+ start:11459 stop:11722 length:264 start_codon:yes stop_codon:yes gene_type:complete